MFYPDRMKSSLCALLLTTLLPLSLAAQASPAAQAPPAVQTPAPVSKSVNVTVDGKVSTFSVKNLLEMPQTTVHVHNVQKNADETYTGPLVSEVLAAAGLKVERETESTLLHSAVVATGAYRYFVVYSAAELEPSFNRSQTIVAVMKAGLPNPEGAIELINTSDANASRWVHGLTGLAVMTLSQNK